MQTYSSEFPMSIMIAAIAINILMIWSLWVIYKKADQPGWACIVPFYNYIVLLEIVGKPTWWILLFFVPFANVILMVWMINMLSKSFGKDEGFTLGLIFLPFIFFPILAFSEAEYLGPYGMNGNERDYFDDVIDRNY